MTLLLSVLLASCATLPSEPTYPVNPILFTDRFEAAEGITFNSAGELHVGANRAVWRLDTEGNAVKLADLDSNLGQAGIGPRDVLAADFGPTNIFNNGDEQELDGKVFRVTPDGTRTVAAQGIHDPNAILVLPDGSFLVSDDGLNAIYRVPAGAGAKDKGGAVAELWTDSVPFPNGMVLSPDNRTIWVAQIFTQVGPVVLDGKLWAVELNNDMSAGEARVVSELVADGVKAKGADGLAIDERGRVYVADNNNGRVLRYDPESGPREDNVIVIASGMPHIASLVFGEGAFDHLSLYATTTFRGGGDIWRIPVGVRGLKVLRGEGE